MITTLDALIAFTQRRAELPYRVALAQPGCAAEAMTQLAKRLPRMPNSYLSVIRAIALDHVAIGYFWLSPEAFPGHDLAERLIACNDPARNPLVDIFCRHGVYQVASWEADPIGVVYSEGLFKAGQTVLYNSGNFEETPEVIGKTFDQFLLLVGNLYAVRDTYGKTGSSQAFTAFEACLNQLVSPEHDNIRRAWNRIAEEVL